MEVEVQAEIRRKRLNKVGGHTHLISEHFKKWLREAYLMEETSYPQKTERCRNLVDLTQYM